MARTLLVTGGAGFIGSHLVRRLVQRYPDYRILNLDLLTYAGNLENLRDIEDADNYTFVKGDICDSSLLQNLFRDYGIDGVIHLAAESHVDRSILNPTAFVTTNVLGTVTLLNAARQAWGDRDDVRFYHVSTDEVYGSLRDGEYFLETTAYNPQSPYSASKAASDHFVRAYGNTYGFPFVISNCSNNYGPYQFPEKLLPLFIANIVQEKALPVYGQGLNVRDWLWVEDHCAAIDLIFHQGQNGETYNIGGRNEWKNIDLIHLLCRKMDEKLGRPAGHSASLIRYVTDRPGHDMRYAIDPSKLERELGWTPSLTFEEGLARTIDWYLSHQEWVNRVQSGAYQDYYQEQYGTR
ncbi:MAG: dTDP-glucose 4,6-dehydratase [Bacteroidetes bacterium]|nr:MAG: dTDP-glucose 4,6-dehydratase [Bacteroidota bacterium]